jgi:transcriptional regulator with XRE-family HTH domain
MTVNEQIKILCIRNGISLAELSRKMGLTPQSLNGKMKRGKFSVYDLEEMAKALDCRFERYFVLPNGEKI